MIKKKLVIAALSVSLIFGVNQSKAGLPLFLRLVFLMLVVL
jgi:hypothetical protein